MLNSIKYVRKKLSEYIDLTYVVRFILLLLAVYYFNIFYTAIVDKNGMIYSSFLDNNLNYISGLRNSILYTSDAIAHLMGLNSYVFLPYQLRTMNGSYVETVYGCLGLGLMSFWVAFVLANKESLTRKIIWCFSGILSIWIINCFRVALLLAAFENHWKVNSILDHHTQFNIVAYSLIIFLIWLYINSSKKALEKSI